MAITYIVGNPGSGKTYFGVKSLYDNFIKEKKSSIFDKLKFSKIDPTKDEKSLIIAYTNINQFNFNASDKIKKFEFDDFYQKITLVYNAYFFEKADDTRLIEILKELNLYRAMFVIDEIHNFFNNPDDVLIWWLTYHRHLYQELFFITQSLALIPPCYKNVAEFFYKAADSSKRFFSKKFRYSQYTTPGLYSKDLISKINIDFDENVFKLYHSGNSGLGKSAVKKFFIIALILLIFSVMVFKIILNSFFTPDLPPEKLKKDENITKQDFNTTQPKHTKHILQEASFKDIPEIVSFYYVFTCTYNICIFENSYNYFDRDLIFKLIYKTKVLHRSKSVLLNGLERYSFLLESDIFKPLNIQYKGYTDEKTTSTIFDGFGGSSSSR